MKLQNFKKGQIVIVKSTEDNLDKFVADEDGIIRGRVIKNKGWSFGNIITDPVDVQIKKKVGKSKEAVFGISRSELSLAN